MKIHDFMHATQNEAAVTKLWLQFPDSLSPLGKGGQESLTSETSHRHDVVETVTLEKQSCLVMVDDGTLQLDYILLPSTNTDVCL